MRTPTFILLLCFSLNSCQQPDWSSDVPRHLGDDSVTSQQVRNSIKTILDTMSDLDSCPVFSYWDTGKRIICVSAYAKENSRFSNERFVIFDSQMHDALSEAFPDKNYLCYFRIYIKEWEGGLLPKVTYSKAESIIEPDKY